MVLWRRVRMAVAVRNIRNRGILRTLYAPHLHHRHWRTLVRNNIYNKLRQTVVKLQGLVMFKISNIKYSNIKCKHIHSSCLTINTRIQDSSHFSNINSWWDLMANTSMFLRCIIIMDIRGKL